MKKALLSWSGGKDCLLALERIRQQGTYEVVSLLTTVTEDVDRISMHGVRQSLLEAQAQSLQLPVTTVRIPPAANNDTYEQRMRETLEHFCDDGVDTVIFGDVFLTDVREYRERQLAQMGMRAHFPLWGEATDRLVRSFLAEGYKATTVCVDAEALPKRFVGRDLSPSFFKELPDTCDLCGENGEYHTFVYDGPAFRSPIPIVKGDIVLREKRFYYCDLLLDRQ